VYGVTTSGGAFNRGTVFHVGLTDTVSTVYDFTPDHVGFPISLMQASDGILYGTTNPDMQGRNNCVFSLQTDGTGFMIVRCLQRDLEGDRIGTLVEASTGVFYAATSHGGPYGRGTLLRLTRVGTVTVLRAFRGDGNGGVPRSPLVRGQDGALYGTTGSGGVGCVDSGGCGVIFRYDEKSESPLFHRVPGILVYQTGVN
jgi:uncharacterized repeat protein (TIGR03803 family)